MRPPPDDQPMPISQAPLRVQREHYRRERRNSAIAIGVIVIIVALIGWALL